MSIIQNNEIEILKKPYSKIHFNNEQNFLDLMECIQDPLFFMRNFMKARHPIKGSVPFEPYPYQIKLVEAFQKHRFNAVLAGRQLGKSSTFNSIINKDGNKVKIGKLFNLSLKKRIISWLENMMIYLA